MVHRAMRITLTRHEAIMTLTINRMLVLVLEPRKMNLSTLGVETAPPS